MGTRAFYGFVYNNEIKGQYNHYDGYPRYLGCNLKEELRNYTVDFMRDKFDKIIMIDDDDSIIPNKILHDLVEKDYVKIPNINKDLTWFTWYNALRDWQGRIEPIMEYDGYEYMLDGIPYVPSYEYMYIIDLNDESFITKSFMYREDEMLKGPFNYNDFIEKIHHKRGALIIKLDELRNMSNKEYLKLFDLSYTQIPIEDD